MNSKKIIYLDYAANTPVDAKATQNGLVHLQGVPGLRKAIKDLKQENVER